MSDVDTNTANDSTSSQLLNVREGLPKNYRMRADRHYVEQLSGGHFTRHSDRHADETARTTPAIEREPSSRQDDLLAALAAQTEAIDAAWRLLDSGTAALGRRAAQDLVAAHARRASWLIQASRLAANPHPRPRGREPLGATIDRLTEQLAPEARLTGIDVRAHVDDRTYGVRLGDDTLFTGLVGAVVALAPWNAPGGQDPVIVTGGPSDVAVTLEVRRANLSLDAASIDRFFDESWTHRPGGWVPALGARVFRIAVEAFGGIVTCTARGRDTALTATFS